MTHQELEEQTQPLVRAVVACITQFGLDWLSWPVDHVAIKAADTPSYEALIQDVLPISKSLSYIEMDARRLATAQLQEPISCGQFGSCDILEIMEPRPAKVGQDYVGVEHLELFSSSGLDRPKALLEASSLAYEFQENPGHQALVVVLDDEGREFKVTDRPLAGIVEKQVAYQTARVIK